MRWQIAHVIRIAVKRCVGTRITTAPTRKSVRAIASKLARLVRSESLSPQMNHNAGACPAQAISRRHEHRNAASLSDIESVERRVFCKEVIVPAILN